ncbi:MAG: cytochrome P450 [Gammaproteobacteria bacterium]|nr:cytochrome P450 [Gammaproteobacteria bacterium]
MMPANEVESRGRVVTDEQSMAQRDLEESISRSIGDLPGPAGLPLVGNLHQLTFRGLGHIHLKLEEWADRYGDIFLVHFANRPALVISDRIAIQGILLDRPDSFRRTSILEAAASDMRLKGVFAAEGDDWRRQRRMVVNALNRTRLKTLFPVFRVMLGRLMRRWQRAADEGKAVDLCQDLMRFTVDVTMQVAFGIDPNTQETEGPVIQNHLDKVFPVLHRRVFQPFPIWRYIRLPSDHGLDLALNALQEEVSEMVYAARERMKSDPMLAESPTNFLESILVALDQENSEFTDEDVFANAGTLLLAGEDTTANSIAWSVHYMTLYPEHFQRTKNEVDRVAGPDRELLEMEQMGKLPRLDAFYNEVMRLKPVAPLQVSQSISDVDIMGYRVPGGTPIYMLARRMATRNENFANGRQFDPDRWLAVRDRGHCPHERQAFIPFGAGPRLCPGRSLALLEIRMVLSMLCRNFDLETVNGGSAVEERMAFSMMPANLHVVLKRREVF